MYKKKKRKNKTNHTISAPHNLTYTVRWIRINIQRILKRQGWNLFFVVGVNHISLKWQGVNIIYPLVCSYV
jgi:hypothetical protein